MCSKWSTKILLAGSTADRVCGSIFREYYVRPDSVWNFEVPESIFVGAPSTSTDGWFFTFHRHPKCGISEPKCAMWRVNLNHFMILLWQLFRLDHWRLTRIRFRNIESGYLSEGPASGTRVKLNLLRNLTSQKTYVTRAFAPDLFVSDSLLTYWSWRRRIYILASCIIDYSTQLLPLHHRTSALATYRNTRNLVAQSSNYSA